MGVGTNLDTVWGIGKGRFDVTDPSTLTLSNERPSEDHDLSSSPTRSTSSSFQPSAQRTGISLHGFAHVAGGQTHCYLAGTCNVNAGILIAARSGLRPPRVVCLMGLGMANKVICACPGKAMLGATHRQTRTTQLGR